MSTTESSVSVRTLLQLYCKHRRFFSLNYHENFKLFVSWYLSQPIVTWTFQDRVGIQLPWYRRNYEIQELAKILKCTEQEVLGIIEEIHDEY